jgi:hypothetical protein
MPISPTITAKKAQKVIVCFLTAAMLLLLSAPAQAEERAGGEGLFGDNPLASGTTDFECGSSLLVPPLFSFQRTAVFKETGFLGTPWTGWIFDYIETREGRRKFSIFPLISYFESDTDNKFSLDMLFWLFSISRSGERYSASIFPLLFWTECAKNGHTVLFPLFWRYWDEESSAFLFNPLYGQLRSKDFDWTSVLFPVYFGSRSEWGSSNHILWPLINWYSGPGKRGFRFAPFIFYGHADPSEPYPHFADRRPFESGNAGTPGLLQNDSVEAAALPRYAYKNQGSDYLVIFPIFWDIDFGETRYFHIWPFFGRDVDVGGWTQYSTLFPFFRYSYTDTWNHSTLWCPWPILKFEAKDSVYAVDNAGVFSTFGREKSASLLFLFEHTSNPMATSTRVYPVFSVWPALDIFRHVHVKSPDEQEEYVDTQVLPGIFKNTWRKTGEKTFFSLELGPVFLYKSGNIYDFNKNTLGDQKETGWDVLLGLVSFRGLEKKKKVGFLWGFAGYEEDGESCSIRILWFRF